MSLPRIKLITTLRVVFILSLSSGVCFAETSDVTMIIAAWRRACDEAMSSTSGDSAVLKLEKITAAMRAREERPHDREKMFPLLDLRLAQAWAHAGSRDKALGYLKKVASWHSTSKEGQITISRLPADLADEVFILHSEIMAASLPPDAAYKVFDLSSSTAPPSFAFVYEPSEENGGDVTEDEQCWMIALSTQDKTGRFKITDHARVIGQRGGLLAMSAKEWQKLWLTGVSKFAEYADELKSSKVTKSPISSFSLSVENGKLEQPAHAVYVRTHNVPRAQEEEEPAAQDPFNAPFINNKQSVAPPPILQLRFGRTEENLGELLSVCEGPNLDYSISDEEARQLQDLARYRLALIKSEPGLALILVDQIEGVINHVLTRKDNPSDSLTNLFRALALRPDVDPAAVKRCALEASRLFARVDRCKTVPITIQEANLNLHFKQGLPDLLGACPTKEGEDYLIQILVHPVVPYEFPLQDKVPSIMAAGKSGSARCLAGLQQALKELESLHQHQVTFGDMSNQELLETVRGFVKKLQSAPNP